MLVVLPFQLPALTFERPLFPAGLKNPVGFRSILQRTEVVLASNVTPSLQMEKTLLLRDPRPFQNKSRMNTIWYFLKRRLYSNLFLYMKHQLLCGVSIVAQRWRCQK